MSLRQRACVPSSFPVRARAAILLRTPDYLSHPLDAQGVTGWRNQATVATRTALPGRLLGLLGLHMSVLDRLVRLQTLRLSEARHAPVLRQ